MIAIIQSLGTPKHSDFDEMSPEFSNKEMIMQYRIQGQSWQNLLFNDHSKEMADPAVCDLLSQIMRYNPKKRLGLYKAMAHPYFDELRDQNTYLPTGNCLPDLFYFSP